MKRYTNCHRRKSQRKPIDRYMSALRRCQPISLSLSHEKTETSSPDNDVSLCQEMEFRIPNLVETSLIIQRQSRKEREKNERSRK